MPGDVYSTDLIELGSAHHRTAQRLRGQVYLDQGFLKKDETTKDGRDDDKDDRRSIHIGAFDLLGQLVGTIRVIMPDATGLPISRIFGGVEISDRAVEISRFAVLESHRHLPVVLGLCRAACHVVEQNDKDDMYAVMETELLEKLLWFGFPFRTLKGGPKEVYKSTNYPTCCSQEATAAQMRQQDLTRPQQIAPFFEAPFSFDEATVYEELFFPNGVRGI